MNLFVCRKIHLGDERTLYSIITVFAPLKYHVFESIMENGAFAHLEQMLLFP